jgi:ABC-type thiamine transport system substrate-binding protein
VESVPLVTWWSAPGDLRAGCYTVDFECHIPFSAGEINFVVGISTHEIAVYYAEGVGSAAISEIAVGEQPLRSSGTGLIATTERPTIRNA